MGNLTHASCTCQCENTKKNAHIFKHIVPSSHLSTTTTNVSPLQSHIILSSLGVGPAPPVNVVVVPVVVLSVDPVVVLSVLSVTVVVVLEVRSRHSWIWQPGTKIRIHNNSNEITNSEITVEVDNIMPFRFDFNGFIMLTTLAVI